MEETEGHDLLRSSQEGGMYLPASGTIKVLVVCIRFPDDNYDSPNWPAGQSPNWMNTIIDADLQQNSTNYANLTHFFNVMSLGKLKMIGNTVYVEAPHSASHYGYVPGASIYDYPNNYANRYDATKDVLTQVVDPLVDFSQYDNWTFNSNYNHTNQADGVVDMVIMVWRGNYNRITRWFGGWNGFASLGSGAEYRVDNNSIIIRSGYGGGKSGVTVHYHKIHEDGIFYNGFNSFNHIAHEFSHYLLGVFHPYGSTSPEHYGHTMHGLLAGGFCVNAFERERLGWSDNILITGETTVNIPDFLTSEISYKYQPPNGSINEYYYFENHQKIESIYDEATLNSADKGIFVVHQKDVYNNTNNIRVKTSDGQWHWENPFWVTTGSSELPAFRKDYPDPFKYNHKDKLPHTRNGFQWIYVLADENDDWQFLGEDYRLGKYESGAFDESYNNVLSPWSNPNSHTWNGNSTNFAMEIVDQIGSQMSVHFYYNNAVDASPAKPQNFQLSIHQDIYPYRPKLTWEASTEPDLAGVSD